MKRLSLFILLIVSLFVVISCSSADESAENSSSEIESSEPYAPLENVYGNTITVEMKIKDFGVMTLELYPDEAPLTVANFISKVEEKFYDGLIIHRVVPGFVIQGGKPVYGEIFEPIKGEFSANGITNRIPHQKGVISMARKEGDNNSATSQFFICASTSEYISNLDGSYAAFGCVTSGIRVLDLITTVSTDAEDKPYKDVVIEYIKVISSTLDAESETETTSEESNVSDDVTSDASFASEEISDIE